MFPIDLWLEDDPPLVILAPYGSMAFWREWSAEVLRRRQ
jgi:hypothetical protein